MAAGRLGAVIVASVAVIALLSGCGERGGRKAPDVRRLPLVRGASIVAQAKECDPGKRAFCALELVVEHPGLRTSSQLLARQRLLLQRSGWRAVNGDTGDERAAQSPGRRLRVTYATADGDLKAVDLGWIRRPRNITLALSRALFDRRAALSLMLEAGSG
jgi:hypothetical protein